MKLALMQPYFFPYLGYYDLINRTDRLIVFDLAQYRPQSWMNRNRVLQTDGGWCYITVPVEKSTSTRRIRDVRIVDAKASHRRIIGQIEHYRTRRAPFFERARHLIDRCFADLQTGTLLELNVRTLALTCEYLGISLNHSLLSELHLDLPPISYAGGWGLEVSTALSASEYVNLPNGRAIFKPEEFAHRRIKLTFTELLDYAYDCPGAEFIEHLSIIDVIMWNEPEAIKAVLLAAKAN